MKFSCEKALLLGAVSTASRAVAVKSSIPALEGILIEAGEQLRLTGYNLETGIRAAVPAEIREKGSLVLSARLFGEIIRKMPDDVVVFTSENYMVNIKCGLTVVSVDGYRLARRHEPVDSSQGVLPFSFVVPGSALSEVEKICAGEDAVSVAQGARHIQFQAGDTVLVCRRLEGEFLAYKNAIPRNNTIKIEGDARTLLQSIERVSLIISDKLKSPLRCVFGDGMLSITTKTGIGDAADQCPITGDGQGLEIGFNNKYLMDALKAAPADRLRLEFTSGVAPCVILPAEGEENFVYMVLPVRLKAN